MTGRNNYYVYFHTDKDGNVFYVGKGTGKRAWRGTGERHHIWQRYVAEHLNGEYDVQIYRDGLTEDQALDLEQDREIHYGDALVNLSSMGRSYNAEALEEFNSRQRANREFVALTKPLEAANPDKAIDRYLEALSEAREYSAIQRETGLVARVLADEKNLQDTVIVDRLSMLLCKHGRVDEMSAIMSDLVQTFQSYSQTNAAVKVWGRIEKAVNKGLG